MPPVLKFQILFEEDSGYGWSEIHFKQATAENPNLGVALDNFNANILTKRQLILGKGDNIVGSRVSYPRVGAIASLGARFFVGGVPTQPGTAPALSLACQFQNADATKHKIVHLRGFWDAVESDGGYDPSGAAEWPSRFAQWKQALIDQSYGWLTKDIATSSRGEVVDFVQNADLTVTFTLDVQVGTLPVDGKPYQVRFSKLNNGKSVLNRSLLVFVSDVNQLTTVNQVATGPFLAKGKFNLRRTSFVAYNALGSVSLGERRMGRPLNRYPGRSKARATV